jgi:uncharacterized membrane protein
MATKIIGYILALAGLVVIALSKLILNLSFISKLGAKSNLYINIAGGILVILGIVLIMMDPSSNSSSKIKHASEEVPIYEGEGKKRKIVGYRKAE